MTAIRQLSNSTGSIPAAASRFLRYVDKSPTPFHATAVSADMLEKAGFIRLQEAESWQDLIEAGGRYFFTRNQSALVAFAVGHHFRPGGGVHVVGAHTDSPNFHIKPISKRAKEGYMQCSVETYGGGLWSTWFDRDLSIAGRVIVADSHAQTSFTSKLVHIKEPLLRIPNLAIHLNRGAGDNFQFNVEDNTLPILGLSAAAELNKESANASDDAHVNQGVGTPTMTSKHHPVLLQLLSKELGCDVEQIQDFELSLYDTQPAAVGGVDNAFIFSPRLDNQMSCFCATEALIGSLKNPSALHKSSSIRAIALFDNEEVGSVSTHGAESNMLASTVRRLVSIPVKGIRLHGDEHLEATAYERAIAQSFLISSDMAHAFHPNYPSSYENDHRPKLNGGPVIKTNAKQRYASTAPTTFLLRRLAKIANVPLQEFEVRNDMPCGSTIGPMMSKTGIRTVDIGNPQLAMHSIRETCGSADPEYKIRLFEAFFEHFETVDKELKVD
ncbi:putative aspartyl aminopeptidase [Tilletiaria anomala UBC 951]|uniref:aspartyl aminopeptidase n=1 Tax=Tilletiaria anomala (strain ATCC 24038 / CBS 436.72 / UBC 951) TaxID=1037660 RepID=A0A066WAN5_TILAU|nr:putative aspartyl aminopeptidase [Tilletiaria anomala UBC 951]KDN49618.1 putative aspartyl aminopeptidase [Tilletiaria anomala UBC 951]